MPISLLIGRAVAECCGLIWRLGLVAAAVLLVLAGFFTHFMGLAAAFELQNLDSKPLAEDPLLGALASFVPEEAQLGHFSAFFMSLGVGLGLLLVGHALFVLLRGCSEYRAYRALDDQASARQLHGLLVLWGGVLLALALPLGWLLAWDVELFRYRALAGVSGLTDVTELVQGLPVWDQLSDDARRLSAVNIAYGAGTLGYVAATLLSCLLLEIATLDVREQWLRLCALLAPVNTFAQEPAAEYPTSDEGSASSEPTEVAPATPGLKPEQAEATTPGSAQPVIGGRPGEAVSLEQALQDTQRYHVDAETRSIWARAHWDSLHAQPQTERKAA